MKPKKMSFKEISGVMSRDEMKKIMAGSGGSKCSIYCQRDADCDISCPYCSNNYPYKMCTKS